MSSKKRERKSYSRNHTTKTPVEQDLYIKKVKHSDSPGQTNITLETSGSSENTATLPESTSATSTRDRERITPPFKMKVARIIFSNG